MNNERKVFLTLAGILVGFGVLMVHSASITSRPSQFEEVHLSRHLLFLGLGISSACVASQIPSTTWRKLAPFLLFGTILLLVAVLIPGIGSRVKGAQRWIRLERFSFQPSEIAKLTVPLYLSAILAQRTSLASITRSVFALVPVGIAVVLTLVEPDFGMGVFLSAAAAITLFVGGWPIGYFMVAATVAIPAAGFVVMQKSYQMQRITGFVSSWQDWSKAPYQLKQSLVTIGDGGLYGVGLGRGFQKLSFLPEANTDFVFAVIGEELGLSGTLTVLALWCVFYFVGLRVVSRVDRGTFEHTAAHTLLTLLILQVILNVSVVTGMVPPKGIPHPFISCGGSNLVISLTLIGVVMSLTRPKLTSA